MAEYEDTRSIHAHPKPLMSDHSPLPPLDPHEAGQRWRITDVDVPFGSVIRWALKMAAALVILEVIAGALFLIAWLIVMTFGLMAVGMASH